MINKKEDKFFNKNIKEKIFRNFILIIKKTYLLGTHFFGSHIIKLKFYILSVKKKRKVKHLNLQVIKILDNTIFFFRSISP